VIAKLPPLLTTPVRPAELNRWRLRLFCGHIVERSYNKDQAKPTSLPWADCPECGAKHQAYVAWELTSGVEEGAVPPRPAPEEARRRRSAAKTKAQLIDEIEQLRAQLDALTPKNEHQVSS
jgi:hypothetical protein